MPNIFKARKFITLKFLLLFSFGASAGEPLLGPQTLSLDSSCANLLTRTLQATQIEFARNFLRYPPDDIQTGLFAALMAYFPRSTVLFSEPLSGSDTVNKNSISWFLRREGHREADRTFTSILLLQKILRGMNPQEFKTPIAPLNPTEAEILKIRQLVFEFLTGDSQIIFDGNEFEKVKLERLHALIVRLIFHDQGKFETVLRELRIRISEGGEDPNLVLSADHDLATKLMMDRFRMEMGDLNTVFPEPDAWMKKSQIGALNPGRVFQFEAPAAHLAPLQNLDHETFLFWLVKEIFDVGGVKGSEHPSGSFWIKPVINNYFQLLEAYRLGQIGKSSTEITKYYRSLLQKAGQELGIVGQTSEDLAIIKLARLFRLNQFPEIGRNRRIQILKNLFLNLDSKDRAKLIEELNLNGVDDGWAFTFGYLPQVSENIQTSLGVWVKTAEESATDVSIANALDVSIKILLKIVNLARPNVSNDLLQKNGEYTLEMPGIADFIKKNGTAGLLETPLNFKPAGLNSATITLGTK